MYKRILDSTDLDHFSKRQRLLDRPLPDEQVVAEHPLEPQPHSEEVLCDGCRAVDWSSVATLAADGLLKTKQLNLRSWKATFEELRDSSCPICAILSISAKPYPGPNHLVLRAIPLTSSFNSGSDTFRDKHPTPDGASQCTVLSLIRPSGYLKPHFETSLAAVILDDLQSKKITPSSIDYEELKNLVKTCQKEHKRCCKAKSRTNVPGLEVIDVRRQPLQVIKAPDQCEYLALSYVWGEKQGDSLVHNLENPPAVIKDAISVTKFMGYEYLWVDRYCISNSEDPDRHRMISQMDHIYANASITIIAAADGDTERGLCGVSMPRRSQRRVDIGDVSLLELPNGHEDVRSSAWASRAWTYQEGYLSTRRLVFTASQVVFLCNGMYAAESLQQLLGTTCCIDETARFRNIIPDFPNWKRQFSRPDILQQTEEYSKRDLARPSDSLNAFLGILNYYGNNSARLKSPVLQLPWGLIAIKDSGNDAFNLSFFWSHDAPATRRADFPSWSWPGWGGTIKFLGSDIVLQSGHKVKGDPLFYYDWELFMRDTDGKVSNMYDLALKELKARKVKHQLYQPGPKQLLITCTVIPVSFREFRMTEDQRHHQTEVAIYDTSELWKVGRDISNGVAPVLQVWNGIYATRDREYLQLDQQIQQEDCVLGLVYAYKHYGFIYHLCLLVREVGVGEGLYERVGLLRLADPASADPAAFLNQRGDILDKVTISDRQRKYPYTETAELRTICLI